MKRQLTRAVIACFAMSWLIALAPTVADAAPAATPCFPPAQAGDYPPPPLAIEHDLAVDLTNGILLPSHTNNRLVVDHGHPNLVYCGILHSTPVTLEPTTASSAGVIDFDQIALPSTFQLGVVHQLDVYRQESLVGEFSFCVNPQGHLVNASSCPAGTATKAGGSLPRTGMARLADALKAAGVAFAAGVLFLYLRRRRAASVSQA